MFHKTLTFCVGLLFLTQLAVAQTNTARTATLTPTKITKANTLQTSSSADVKAFSLMVIQNYFDHKCEENYDLLHNEIMSFESGQKFEKSAELQKMYCEDDPLRTDIQVSYQMYLENYSQVVMSQAQLEEKYPGMTAKLGLQEGDFFFNGATPKAAGATRVFRASDVASFVVRKIRGAWKIIAL